MEHVFHIFGGGCGEHNLLVWFLTALTSLSGASMYFKTCICGMSQRVDKDSQE